MLKTQVACTGTIIEQHKHQQRTKQQSTFKQSKPKQFRNKTKNQYPTCHTDTPSMIRKQNRNTKQSTSHLWLKWARRE